MYISHHDPTLLAQGTIVHAPSSCFCMVTLILTSFPKLWWTVPVIPTVISPGRTAGEGDSDIDVNVT